MSQTPRDFRATKDIDMIILFEDKFKEFAQLFWNYVREGGYTYGWKNSDEPHFYRFTDPKEGYPKQIELFSRKTYYFDGQGHMVTGFFKKWTTTYFFGEDGAQVKGRTITRWFKKYTFDDNGLLVK